MSGRCIHELDPASCAVCNGAEKRQAAQRGPDPSGFGRWFEARLAGRCSGCDERVEPGDMIRADGEGGYVCWECGDAAA